MAPAAVVQTRLLWLGPGGLTEPGSGCGPGLARERMCSHVRLLPPRAGWMPRALCTADGGCGVRYRLGHLSAPRWE